MKRGNWNHQVNMFVLTTSMSLYYYVVFLFLFCVLTNTNAVAVNCFGGVDNAPCQNWVNDTGSAYNVSTCYNTTSANITTQGIALHWRMDEENIYLAVATRAIGWVGFGLAEAGGGMKGADMVLFESGNPGIIRDTHILDERVPMDDVCQDWVFVDARTDDGFIILETFRKLNTLDAQDRAIINDSNSAVPAQFVIAAWGDSSTAVFNASTNAVRASVRWYGQEGDERTAVKETLAEQSDGFFDLEIVYDIKPMVTDYQSFCFNWDPDITSQGVPNEPITIIALEVVTDEASRRFIHNADVYGATTPGNESRVCAPQSGYNTVFSWAAGVQPLLLPNDVGYNFGPTSDDSKIQAFRVQVHYNNPELKENFTDHTVVRIYYSITPRKQELGLMEMGDVLDVLNGTDVPAGLSEFEYTCQSDCSTLTLDEPVTVFQESYYMHASGVSAVTYHIRNDAIIRQGQIDFYDFNQSGVPTVRQEPFTINPGDSFVTKFWFNSTNGTTFGQSSYEEMNKAVFMYYPAKTLVGVAPWSCVLGLPIAVCNASVDFRSLTTTAAPIERIFGTTPTQCIEKATRAPTKVPSKAPTKVLSNAPTNVPSNTPTRVPSHAPTKVPSNAPSTSKASTITPTKAPLTATKSLTNAPATAPLPVATTSANAPTSAGFFLFCPLIPLIAAILITIGLLLTSGEGK